mmetsp:Transcript_4972/g.31807  ORF Transcript_4972/g.31807 Transcript_4972/m.31807 type:complete len:305 (+) Transcript_4972:499-1413(+)
MRFRQPLETSQISDTDASCQFKIGHQSFPIDGLLKERPIWNLSQQESHRDEPLLNLHLEPPGLLRGLPGCLHQTLPSIYIVQLHRSDASKVIKVTTILAVGVGLRLLCLRPELFSLVVQVIVQKVSEEQIQQRFLTHFIVSQGGRGVRSQELRPHFTECSRALVGPGEVEEDTCTDEIERPAIEPFHKLHGFLGKKLGIRIHFMIDKHDENNEEDKGFRFRQLFREAQVLCLVYFSVFHLHHVSPFSANLLQQFQQQVPGFYVGNDRVRQFFRHVHREALSYGEALAKHAIDRPVFLRGHGFAE